MNDVKREVLPIPDLTPAGLTTYVATDPDTSYPPIVPLRPPAGAPNVLNAFSGKVHWVRLDIDVAAADQDHRIAPEERFRLAMAKQ